MLLAIPLNCFLREDALNQEFYLSLLAFGLLHRRAGLFHAGSRTVLLLQGAFEPRHAIPQPVARFPQFFRAARRAVATVDPRRMAELVLVFGRCLFGPSQEIVRPS